MDFETGETSLADRETGELPATRLLNSETGEQECNYACPPQLRRTRPSFRVPRSPPGRRPPPPDTCAITPALMFFLPTAFFFNPLLALVLVSAEIGCHAWSHRRNRRLRGTDAERFRSPLHVFVREFCGSCRERAASDKINQMHERCRARRCGIECVRQIVT